MNIEIKDLNISYYKIGRGNDKILLLHGWGSNKEIFKDIAQKLSVNMEVYAIDLPGFGSSAEPSFVWGTDDYTDLIIEFIEKMQIKKLSILGHSFGGRLMIRLANRKDLNFKIEKYVLIDSAGIKHSTQSKKIKQRFNKLMFKIVRIFSDKLVNHLKTKVGSRDYRNATPMMRNILVKTVNEDLKNLIINIQYPTLIIWGENDLDTPFEDALFMNSVIKDSGIVKIENGGHYSFLDNPYLVNKTLEIFLIGDKS